MNKNELLLIVLRAINEVGIDKFKETSMFTGIKAKKAAKNSDQKAA